MPYTKTGNMPSPKQRFEMYGLLRDHCKPVPGTNGLVKFDDEWSDERIASAVGVTVGSVVSARRASLGRIIGHRGAGSGTVGQRLERMEVAFNAFLDKVGEPDFKV